MTTTTATPGRQGTRAEHGSFSDLLHAEWTKFRTVRGWVIGVVVAALVIVLVGLLSAAGSHTSCNGGPCRFLYPVGPGGEAVTDSFYFVHRPLADHGSITARVTSLTGLLPTAAAGRSAPPRARVGDASRPRAVVQGRAHHQGEHPAGVGVRGHDGHRPPWGADAVRLHPGRGRSARRRHRVVPALAAADPGRRHGHRLRLGRRPALDAGRHRHPARAATDRAGRAVRHLPRLQRDDRPGPARDQRDRRAHPGHRRPRPRQPARRPAGRRVGRHRHRRRPQRRDPGPGRRVSPGRRRVHGDRVRRHRAGRTRRRGPRPDRRFHPGGRVRRA